MWGVQVNALFAFVYFMAFASCVKSYSARCFCQRTLCFCFLDDFLLQCKFFWCIMLCLIQRTTCFRILDGFCNSVKSISVRCLGQRTLRFRSLLDSFYNSVKSFSVRCIGQRTLFSFTWRFLLQCKVCLCRMFSSMNNLLPLTTVFVTV
jgi:hypothetical protein